MKIRKAKSVDESATLRSLSISNGVQYGLLVIGAVGWIWYQGLPEKMQSKVGQYVFWGLSGAGFVSRLINRRIRDGRLAVGDLAEEVASYALLSEEETAQLKKVQMFVEDSAVNIDSVRPEQYLA